MLVPARFNGPPGSGNGGYSAGVMSGGARCQVTLRTPPPLDTPLSVVDGTVRDPAGVVVAELAPLSATGGVGEIGPAVPAIGYAEAVEVSASYEGFVDHPFPTCYVCGPDRPDGLRVFAGRLLDGTTAAPWTVPDDVSVATVWAALDCPSGWAVIGAGRPYVLGRIAVDVRRIPAPGDRCVVRAALVASQGRKADACSTLYGPDGAELARARATWIAIPA